MWVQRKLKLARGYKWRLVPEEEVRGNDSNDQFKRPGNRKPLFFLSQSANMILCSCPWGPKQTTTGMFVRTKMNGYEGEPPQQWLNPTLLRTALGPWRPYRHHHLHWWMPKCRTWHWLIVVVTERIDGAMHNMTRASTLWRVDMLLSVSDRTVADAYWQSHV